MGKRAPCIYKNPAEHFTALYSPVWRTTVRLKDVDACLTDVNKDGFPDLVVASGGNEFYGSDEHLLPRVYLNDGQGAIYQAAQCVYRIV